MQIDHRLDRRSFLRTGTLAVAALAMGGRALDAQVPGSPGIPRLDAGPDDEMTDAVKQVLHDLFGDRPVRVGHMSLDIPADAPDGRAVPVFMESDLPMTPDTSCTA